MTDPAPRPLDGVLVADFSRVLAGPLATMTLADLGATVVKVERPGEGDETRTWGPPWTARSSSYFEAVNRSKLGTTLDLADPGDRALARELARRADVLVQNFRAGAMARHGLAYEQVSAVNPGIVYCSLTGFGGGAGAGLAGYDFVVQAAGGLMSVTGEEDGDPHKVGVALVDVLAGKDAVTGVLAALTARGRTGAGQHVEVSLLSSLLAALVNQASGYLATGVSPRRMGNRHPSIAPYEALRCRDGLVAVACGNDAQFRRLAAAVGAPGLAADARFATNRDRVTHREALVTALEARLAADDAASWERRLVDADVPAARVADVAEAFGRAHELGLAPSVALGDGHALTHPVRYSGFDAAPMTPPPALGEHDALVRTWLADGGDAPLPRAVPAAAAPSTDPHADRHADPPHDPHADPTPRKG